MITKRQQHWQQVYESKQPHEVSWTQEIPSTSLEFIHELQLPKSAAIIDIGGGDSKLVDYLLQEGYENITVLDISAKALDKARQRLGQKAEKVTWLVCDVTEFKPAQTYDLWHDRACFHFLTMQDDIKKYIDLLHRSVNRFLVIGTFSDKGPEKCSGLTVKQYDEKKLSYTLLPGFEKLKCSTIDHITPFNTRQNFLFCSFRKKDMK